MEKHQISFIQPKLIIVLSKIKFIIQFIIIRNSLKQIWLYDLYMWYDLSSWVVRSLLVRYRSGTKSPEFVTDMLIDKHISAFLKHYN